MTNKDTGPDPVDGLHETAPDEVAKFDQGRLSPYRRLQAFLNERPTIAPVIVLILSIAVFSAIAGSKFLHPYNLSLVLQQVTIIGTLGLAQTLVILTAGIDLSVGVIMVLSSIVAGNLAATLGLPTPIAFAGGFGVGFGIGAINGFLVSYTRLPPFIVTLGMFSMIGAMVIFVSGAQTIRAQDVKEVAPALQWTGIAFSIGAARVTLGSILMLLLAGGLWFMLARTAFGRHILAVGDDPGAARLVGINVNKTIFSVYALAGVICAIGGWQLIGRVGAISPSSGQLANLESITAVVIGGTSLFGGRGSVVGTLIGALIVGVFRNGLALSGADVLWQEFSVGLLVILAVLFDQWIRRGAQ